MVDCVFCSIVKGDIPACTVYSDEKIMAFMDIQPVNPGHVLVIPKAHTEQLSKLDPDIGAHMFKIAIRIAEAVRNSGVKCDDVNLHLADGKVAGQEVFHVHLHVIPRFKGDGFGLKFGPNYGLKPDREELDIITNKIKEKLKSK